MDGPSQKPASLPPPVPSLRTDEMDNPKYAASIFDNKTLFASGSMGWSRKNYQNRVTVERPEKGTEHPRVPSHIVRKRRRPKPEPEPEPEPEPVPEPEPEEPEPDMFILGKHTSAGRIAQRKASKLGSLSDWHQRKGSVMSVASRKDSVLSTTSDYFDQHLTAHLKPNRRESTFSTTSSIGGLQNAPVHDRRDSSISRKNSICSTDSATEAIGGLRLSKTLVRKFDSQVAARKASVASVQSTTSTSQVGAGMRKASVASVGSRRDSVFSQGYVFERGMRKGSDCGPAAAEEAPKTRRQERIEERTRKASVEAEADGAGSLEPSPAEAPASQSRRIAEEGLADGAGRKASSGAGTAAEDARTRKVTSVSPNKAMLAAALRKASTDADAAAAPPGFATGSALALDRKARASASALFREPSPEKRVKGDRGTGGRSSSASLSFSSPGRKASTASSSAAGACGPASPASRRSSRKVSAAAAAADSRKGSAAVSSSAGAAGNQASQSPGAEDAAAAAAAHTPGRKKHRSARPRSVAGRREAGWSASSTGFDLTASHGAGGGDFGMSLLSKRDASCKSLVQIQAEQAAQLARTKSPEEYAEEQRLLGLRQRRDDAEQEEIGAAAVRARGRLIPLGKGKATLSLKEAAFIRPRKAAQGGHFSSIQDHACRRHPSITGYWPAEARLTNFPAKNKVTYRDLGQGMQRQEKVLMRDCKQLSSTTQSRLEQFNNDRGVCNQGVRRGSQTYNI
jgi:hypothetical protein